LYQEVPTTLENMKHRIIAACATISPQVLSCIRASGIERLQCCKRTPLEYFWRKNHCFIFFI